MEDLSLLYNKEFFEKSIRKDRQPSYKAIAQYIWDVYKPESVVDYGCGCGWILNFLAVIGVQNILGFERSWDAKTVLDNSELSQFWKNVLKCNIIFGEAADLTKPSRAMVEFVPNCDVAICIEVAEHIEDKYSEIFVETITSKTDLLVFSAAPPGQGGVGHINERTWTYWKNRFTKVGFELCPDQTECFQKYLKECNVKSWYANNIKVLKRS